MQNRKLFIRKFPISIPQARQTLVNSKLITSPFNNITTVYAVYMLSSIELKKYISDRKTGTEFYKLYKLSRVFHTCLELRE